MLLNKLRVNSPTETNNLMCSTVGLLIKDNDQVYWDCVDVGLKRIYEDAHDKYPHDSKAKKQAIHRYGYFSISKDLSNCVSLLRQTDISGPRVGLPEVWETSDNSRDPQEDYARPLAGNDGRHHSSHK